MENKIFFVFFYFLNKMSFWIQFSCYFFHSECKNNGLIWHQKSFWLDEMITTAGRCSLSLAWCHPHGVLRRWKGGGVRLREVICLLATAEMVLVDYLSVFAPRHRLLPSACLRLLPPPPLCSQKCSCTTVRKHVESALRTSEIQADTDGDRGLPHLLAVMWRCVVGRL